MSQTYMQLNYTISNFQGDLLMLFFVGFGFRRWFSKKKKNGSHFCV